MSDQGFIGRGSDGNCTTRDGSVFDAMLVVAMAIEE
jgi:hypothetical protein